MINRHEHRSDVEIEIERQTRERESKSESEREKAIITHGAWNIVRIRYNVSLLNKNATQCLPYAFDMSATIV